MPLTFDQEPIRRTESKHDQVKCPMPGCTASLYITWHASRAIYFSDHGHDLAEPEGAHSSSWEIECGNGHRVLLPPDTASDDYTFGACDQSCADDGLDAHVEDCSARDMVRLRALLSR